MTRMRKGCREEMEGITDGSLAMYNTKTQLFARITT